MSIYPCSRSRVHRESYSCQPYNDWKAKIPKATTQTNVWRSFSTVLCQLFSSPEIRGSNSMRSDVSDGVLGAILLLSGSVSVGLSFSGPFGNHVIEPARLPTTGQEKQPAFNILAPSLLLQNSKCLRYLWNWDEKDAKMSWCCCGQPWRWPRFAFIGEDQKDRKKSWCSPPCQSRRNLGPRSRSVNSSNTILDVHSLLSHHRLPPYKAKTQPVLISRLGGMIPRQSKLFASKTEPNLPHKPLHLSPGTSPQICSVSSRPSKKKARR